MSSKSPLYRRFYRDMLARLIVRLYRDLCRITTKTADELLVFIADFEDLDNSHPHIVEAEVQAEICRGCYHYPA